MNRPASMQAGRALFLYSSLMRLVVPAYLVKLWWRGRVEPLYRHRIGERFGLYRSPPTAGWVWVHAVSLGETRAAAPLIEALRLARPGMRLLLTHGTATGLQAGRDLLRFGDAQTWLPFDLPGAVRRFLEHFDPAVGVLMETEIWPNLLKEARHRHLAMVLANARLSERSLKRGRRFAAVLGPAMARLTIALAQTDDDASRLKEAGVARVVVRGNLKFDMTPDPVLLARGGSWRQLLARPVVMAAATRDGEEADLLQAWRQLADGRTDAPLLLIVPRHPQRFDEVAALARSAGFTVARRSAWIDVPPAGAMAADVWLGDSMREMAQYYGLADVAMLGGSFGPYGGQNLIEASACGCPLVMGPSTFNFEQAARQAESAGAAFRAQGFAHGLALAFDLLDDRKRRERMRTDAHAFSAIHQGAAVVMAGDITAHMPDTDSPADSVVGTRNETMSERLTT